MMIEWAVSLLLTVVDAALGLIAGFMPGLDASGLVSVLGVAMQLNGVFPVGEALSVGTMVLTARLVIAPMSAILSRVTIFGMGPLWGR